MQRHHSSLDPMSPPSANMNMEEEKKAEEATSTTTELLPSSPAKVLPTFIAPYGPNVHVSKHPVLSHKLSILRSSSTSPSSFRQALREITFHLGYEATSTLSTKDIPITVQGTNQFDHIDAIGSRISDKVALIPILRSGLGMVDPMLELVNNATVHHIGMYRSKSPAPPSFSFGAAPKAEPRPFSFGPSTSQQQPSSKKSSSLPSSKPKVKNTAQIEQINKNFFQMIQDHVDGGHLCTDLSSLMDQYTNVAEQLTDEQDDGGDGGNDDGDNNDGDNGTNNGGSAFSGGSSNNDENKKSQPSSTSFSGFSFASSPAPPPSSGATTFSFTGGSAPAPAATTVSKPSFSFGAQPAATSGGSTSNPIAASEDDPTSNPDDGKLDIGQEENKDEETPYQVQARLVKLEGSGNTQAWKKLGTGVLRLYRNTITDKKRMVLRNAAGKVMFNVGVSKGMPFKKVSRKTKNGEVWNVSFAAVEDASEGLKQFMLNVKKEDIDKFHEELEKLAA
mmetsp:Transcript_3777/g.5589  ORF Transcript_3777/g.5589 Transcript_3777/m.5589 type:complete len:504 (-) Transcript_3777:32-1543(-)